MFVIFASFSISFHFLVPPASDKVALLIGNMAYRGNEALNAAHNDVHQLQHNLQLVLKFKCISLLNLVKCDMEKAVDIFCDLISEKSYGRIKVLYLSLIA